MKKNIETIILLMKEISSTQEMPKFYRGDLDIDFSMIRQSLSSRYVWVLRDAGTQLGPVGVGFSPDSITYHAEGSMSSSTNKFFVIDLLQASVTQISADKAIELINRPPQLLAESHEDVLDKTRAVLEKGIEYGFWGLFHPPKSVDERPLTKWLDYFLEHKNEPMEQFMRRALKKIKQHRAEPVLMAC